MVRRQRDHDFARKLGLSKDFIRELRVPLSKHDNEGHP
jgi:hypothetical protein